MELKVAALNFLKYVLRSLGISLLISIAAYCYLTRTFPPDLSRLKNIYSSYKKITKLSAEIKANQTLKAAANAPAQTPEDEDKDIANLIEHRRQIIDLLSQFNFTQPVVKQQITMPTGTRGQLPNGHDEIILPAQSYNNLLVQINDLTHQNNLLQQQIVEIQKQISSKQATQ